jgi:Glycosyl hydrolase family 26
MAPRARGLITGAAALVAVALVVLAFSGAFSADSRSGTPSGRAVAVDRSGFGPIPDAPPRSASPLFWGAWLQNEATGIKAPWDMGLVNAFAALVDKAPSLIGFSSPFANCEQSPCKFYEFPTKQMERLRSYGAIPFFSWGVEAEGKNRFEQPRFQLSDVIAGRYDSYIREFAYQAVAWGHPFFLRLNWEMNGDWFLWSEQVNDNQPGDYVQAWRHIHDIFTQVGATNATWVWCPNSDPRGRLQDLRVLYPGDRYVDWTCLDGYNWGTGSPVVKRKPWTRFAGLFDRSYRRIVDHLAPSKPMVIGEFASSGYGGNQATWIRDALIRIPTRYPRIRGLLWYDINDRRAGWPIESSLASTEAFRKQIDSPVYLGNEFSNLPAGPIAPPARTLEGG